MPINEDKDKKENGLLRDDINEIKFYYRDAKLLEGNTSYLRDKLNKYVKSRAIRTFKVKPIDGSLFESFPSVADIKQGQHGHCYLDSAVITILNTTPAHIYNIMRDNGDGTVDVKLYHNNTPCLYRVDKSKLVPEDDQKGEYDLGAKWFSILLKVYSIHLKHHGIGIRQYSFIENYIANVAEKSEGGFAYRALATITGRTSKFYLELSRYTTTLLTDDEKRAAEQDPAILHQKIYEDLKEKLERGACVTFSTPAAVEDTDSQRQTGHQETINNGIVNTHAYALRAVNRRIKAGKVEYTVVVSNPWDNYAARYENSSGGGGLVLKPFNVTYQSPEDFEQAISSKLGVKTSHETLLTPKRLTTAAENYAGVSEISISDFLKIFYMMDLCEQSELMSVVLNQLYFIIQYAIELQSKIGNKEHEDTLRAIAETQLSIILDSNEKFTVDKKLKALAGFDYLSDQFKDLRESNPIFYHFSHAIDHIHKLVVKNEMHLLETTLEYKVLPELKIRNGDILQHFSQYMSYDGPLQFREKKIKDLYQEFEQYIEGLKNSAPEFYVQMNEKMDDMKDLDIEHRITKLAELILDNGTSQFTSHFHFEYYFHEIEKRVRALDQLNQWVWKSTAVDSTVKDRYTAALDHDLIAGISKINNFYKELTEEIKRMGNEPKLKGLYDPLNEIINNKQWNVKECVTKLKNKMKESKFENIYYGEHFYGVVDAKLTELTKAIADHPLAVNHLALEYFAKWEERVNECFESLVNYIKSEILANNKIPRKFSDQFRQFIDNESDVQNGLAQIIQKMLYAQSIDNESSIQNRLAKLTQIMQYTDFRGVDSNEQHHFGVIGTKLNELNALFSKEQRPSPVDYFGNTQGLIKMDHHRVAKDVIAKCNSGAALNERDVRSALERLAIAYNGIKANASTDKPELRQEIYHVLEKLLKLYAGFSRDTEKEKKAAIDFLRKINNSAVMTDQITKSSSYIPFFRGKQPVVKSSGMSLKPG